MRDDEADVSDRAGRSDGCADKQACRQEDNQTHALNLDS
jgi:hypothetical protein